MPRKNDVPSGLENTKIENATDGDTEEYSDSDFQSNFGSISSVDREAVNGGTRESNWRDRREKRARQGLQPRLEDGAD